MFAVPEVMTLPLHQDADGVIRLSNTRVTLDTLIAFYHQGQTPEVLHQAFPSVPLADIYAVLGYYLANRDTVDIYLQARAGEAARIRADWEAENPPLSKAELLARLSKPNDE